MVTVAAAITERPSLCPFKSDSDSALSSTPRQPEQQLAPVTTGDPVNLILGCGGNYSTRTVGLRAGGHTGVPPVEPQAWWNRFIGVQVRLGQRPRFPALPDGPSMTSAQASAVSPWPMGLFHVKLVHSASRLTFPPRQSPRFDYQGRQWSRRRDPFPHPVPSSPLPDSVVHNRILP